MDAIKEVTQELERARHKFSDFNSAHEGYATILEEVDELWEEVKRQPTQVDPGRLRIEAIQVAAMAIRFVEDVCND